MPAWVVIYRRHLREPRKSNLPRALGAIGDSGPAGKDAILLSLFDFRLSTFDFQLSTFNLRIAPSPTLLALCPKSVKQVSSHQSLPRSFLKLPGCVPTIPKNGTLLSTLATITQVLSFQILAHSFALFCTHRKFNSFLFKRFRTLCQKHRGWGRGWPNVEEIEPRETNIPVARPNR